MNAGPVWKMPAPVYVIQIISELEEDILIISTLHILNPTTGRLPAERCRKSSNPDSRGHQRIGYVTLSRSNRSDWKIKIKDVR
jgi:hypothetical protein